MVRYLLDTNICIVFINGTDPMVRDRLRACQQSQVSLCSVVKAELLFGARNSARVAENLQILNRFLAPFSSLPFDDAAAQEYGILRSHLKREGRLIGPSDMLIAAIALAYRHTLVTRNLNEFRRVPGLNLEGW